MIMVLRKATLAAAVSARYHWVGSRGSAPVFSARLRKPAGTSLCDVAIGWVGFCGTIIEPGRE
jgi:hypothetical protein